MLDMNLVQSNIKNRLLVLPLFLFLSVNLSAICPSTERDTLINDGPYCFMSDDTIRVLWIENSTMHKGYLLPGGKKNTVLPADISLSYRELASVFRTKPDYHQAFKGIDSIAVLSDVHGYYDTYLNHLLANGIIDKDLNWNFGKGHLVFLGDAFDRGDKVTEILWHLFKLEKQAARKGGRVHFILGNHELMILAGDLRYNNEKYTRVESITGIQYPDLYSENSVLGRWLRSKPVMITINDILFVHAGVSPDLVTRELKIEEVNQVFHERIAGKDIYSSPEDGELNLLGGNDGPVWYRGYFEDTIPDVSSLDSVLDFYGKKHIVVGHTPQKSIMALLGNKVIGVDTGMGFGQPGNMLLYKKGRFYKGSITGVRSKI